MQATWGMIISFSAFLVLFLWIGALAARRSKSTENDYLLGSRSFGKWMVGLSAGATGNTSFILIAAVGLAYTQGFGAFWLGIAFFLGEYTFWTFFAEPIARRTEKTGAETVAELVTSSLSSRFAVYVRSLISLLIFVFIGAYIVAQFSGSAKILNVFFGLATPIGVMIALCAILAYCTTGGLRASIWTDLVQAIVMIGMTAGVALYSLSLVGGTSQLTQSLSSLDPTLLEFTRGHSATSLIAFTIGFAFMGAGFGLSQPHVTVRVMAGRSPKEVKQARWIYLAFIYGTWGFMTVFGICARLLMPEIADPEQALPLFAMTHFSPWIVGLVLAGMFSTIASSADSQILACSSAMARDFSPPLDKAMTKRIGIRYQQAATVLTGLIAAIATIYSSSSVFDLVIFSVSVLSASVGAAMLITILKRPTSSLALSLAMLAGVAAALTWRYYGYHDFLSDVAPGLVAALLVHELSMLVLRPENVTAEREVVTPLRPFAAKQQQPDRAANI